jgi:hypothetical protein
MRVATIPIPIPTAQTVTAMDKARIIYVTGMKPKPEPGQHRPELVRVLAAALGRVSPEARAWLNSRPESFVLVSWTALLYTEPCDIGPDLPGIERLLEQPFASAEDRRDADSLRLAVLRAWHLIGDSFSWLSDRVASPALRQTMADVHRYLDNSDGVGDRIRLQLVRELEAAWQAGDRVLLIGHSLGSVIAYDSLWVLSRELASPGRVDCLMTLGSPLATRFIRKDLMGADRSGSERYPANIDRWVNVAARGELVALHRRLRPFFAGMLSSGLIGDIEDDPAIYNHFRSGSGLNPHKSYGYLNHAAVAGRIAAWLGYSS